MPTPLIKHASLRWLSAVITTGIIAGAGGMLLALMLHAIQHVAFGYSMDALVGNESFLQGVTSANTVRRTGVILFAGLVAGFGWWALTRYGEKRVAIKAAVENTQKPMPLITTIIHILLQIATVAMGSPLGREVAPREAGALGAGIIARRWQLSPEDTRLMIACGAGAGLAAVYNVPLAGAMFTLEVLLVSFSAESVIAAFISAGLAAWVATLGLGNESQYHFPAIHATPGMMGWAVIAGPILGFAARQFRVITSTARRNVKYTRQMPIICLLAFGLLALLSIWFPQLPGNGKGPMQLALNGQLTVVMACVLLIAKLVVILAVLRGSAEGGLLTPGMMVGGLISTLLFLAWQWIVPGGDAGGFALIGGAAFLAASMQMPVTAFLLAMEFTHMDHSYFVPAFVCICGSWLTCRALEKSASTTALPAQRK